METLVTKIIELEALESLVSDSVRASKDKELRDIQVALAAARIALEVKHLEDITQDKVDNPDKILQQDLDITKRLNDIGL